MHIIMTYIMSNNIKMIHISIMMKNIFFEASCSYHDERYYIINDKLLIIVSSDSIIDRAAAGVFTISS